MPSPFDPLWQELRRLYIKAGLPSMRAIARRTRGKLSYTTIHLLLNERVAHPRLTSVTALAEALGGDTEHVKALWVAGRAQPLPKPTLAGSAQQQHNALNDVLRSLRDTTQQLLDELADTGRIRSSPALEKLPGMAELVVARAYRLNDELDRGSGAPTGDPEAKGGQSPAGGEPHQSG